MADMAYRLSLYRTEIPQLAFAASFGTYGYDLAS